MKISAIRIAPVKSEVPSALGTAKCAESNGDVYTGNPYKPKKRRLLSNAIIQGFPMIFVLILPDTKESYLVFHTIHLILCNMKSSSWSNVVTFLITGIYRITVIPFILLINSISLFKLLIFPTARLMPQIVKWSILYRHGYSGAFIETGTHRGHTSLFLSLFSRLVVTIEPSRHFLRKAERLFGSSSRIILLNGTSETELEKSIRIVLDNHFKSINFWLDGHFSAGKTFLGSDVSPTLSELNTIAKFKSKFETMTIFIDDLRLFRESEKSGYPDESQLISWAFDHGFSYRVIGDILLLSRQSGE